MPVTSGRTPGEQSSLESDSAREFSREREKRTAPCCLGGPKLLRSILAARDNGGISRDFPSTSP